jgi:hypothetical protein
VRDLATQRHHNSALGERIESICQCGVDLLSEYRDISGIWLDWCRLKYRRWDRATAVVRSLLTRVIPQLPTWETRTSIRTRPMAAPTGRTVVDNTTGRNGFAPTSPRYSVPRPRNCGHRGSIPGNTPGSTATRSANLLSCNVARELQFPVGVPSAAVNRATANPVPVQSLARDTAMAVVDALAWECAAEVGG